MAFWLSLTVYLFHLYAGYSSDSDDDESSHCSFDVAPKGLALLASTAELSSGHSTPVKKPSKKDKTITKRQNKAKSEETGTKKRSLSEDCKWESSVIFY